MSKIAIRVSPTEKPPIQTVEIELPFFAHIIDDYEHTWVSIIREDTLCVCVYDGFQGWECKVSPITPYTEIPQKYIDNPCTEKEYWEGVYKLLDMVKL